MSATFLTTNIVVVPRLGAAATLCFVITRQIAAALLIDQLSVFRPCSCEVSLGRVAGALLAGAVMVWAVKE